MTEIAIATLTAEQARELTAAIRGRVADFLPLIKTAYEGRADRALGYATWSDYCASELDGIRVHLGDRPAMVAELRHNGMSQRAIASALGISQKTVDRDLDSGESFDSPEAPIKGIDGKSYAPTQPARPEQDEPEPVAMPARQDVADAITAAIDEHADGDTRRNAELADVPAVAQARFRSNFATALRRAGELRTFEPDRIAEAFAANYHNDIGRSLESIRNWCDQVEQAHHDHQRGGLRLIAGGAA